MVWQMLGELNIENLPNMLLNSTLDNMIVALLSFAKRWVLKNSLLGFSCYLNCQNFSVGHSHHLHPYQLFHNLKSLFTNPFSHRMGMGAYMDASSNGVLVSWKDIIDGNITRICTNKSSLAIATCQGGFWGGGNSQRELWNRKTIPLNLVQRTQTEELRVISLQVTKAMWLFKDKVKVNLYVGCLCDNPSMSIILLVHSMMHLTTS
jgi:hypothetical protein